MKDQDEYFMTQALAMARKAMDEKEVPVGAVLVLDKTIIGCGWNRGRRTYDPTAHAEMVAIREAASKIGNYRMGDSTLYVTLEPCLMCFGALLEGRISRLVYAVREPRRGVVASLYDLQNDPRLHHRIEVVHGVLEEESRILLTDFFEKKREEEQKESAL